LERGPVYWAEKIACPEDLTAPMSGTLTAKPMFGGAKRYSETEAANCRMARRWPAARRPRSREIEGIVLGPVGAPSYPSNGGRPGEIPLALCQVRPDGAGSWPARSRYRQTTAKEHPPHSAPGSLQPLCIAPGKTPRRLARLERGFLFWDYARSL